MSFDMVSIRAQFHEFAHKLMFHVGFGWGGKERNGFLRISGIFVAEQSNNNVIAISVQAKSGMSIIPSHFDSASSETM